MSAPIVVEPGLDAARERGVLRDWRAGALAVVAGYSTFDPGTALRFGAVICLGVLLSEAGRIRPRAADVLAVALTLWAAMSLTWAVNPSATALAVGNQVAVLAIFVATRTTIRTPTQLAIVAFGFVGGCVVALAKLVNQNQGASFNVELSVARYGIAGVNLNYTAYSLTTGLAIIVLLWQVRGPLHRARPLLLVLVPLFYFGLAQNGSRGAFLGAVLVLAWLVTWRLFPFVGVTVPVLLLCVGVFMTLTGWGDNTLRLLDAGSLRTTENLAGRLAVWPYARESISENPFVGIGAGGFSTINPFGIGAHNVPLEVAAGLGLIGLCLLAASAFSALLAETRTVEPLTRRLLVGTLIAASGPILLSGHWEVAPAGWFALALFSRIGVLPPPPPRRRRGLRRPGALGRARGRRPG
ncbi:O-antigen ligase family protein [Pengzhenrongella sicca]|uniref:O-antigen ligase family protein n=1 Tax=Pengzhenrongella sicca TaxID=2819238 RepID=A0A8A4ZAS5_9MICO|nr:O-antigen ligase family protein [Pengzhenrongella sicca]QTE29022.1 O-antigen ligase family protein [Pengzhenrongella sicca]